MFGQQAQGQGGPPSAWIGNAATGLQVGGIVNSALATAGADRFNSRIMAGEQNLSINQGAAGATELARQNRARLGTQIAAFGSAGTGYGGSAKGALDETALNQEMDALNTKYKVVLTGYGYGVNSQLDRSRANAAGIAGSLTAGAALLKGAGSNYTFSSMGGG